MLLLILIFRNDIGAILLWNLLLVLRIYHLQLVGIVAGHSIVSISFRFGLPRSNLLHLFFCLSWNKQIGRMWVQERRLTFRRVWNKVLLRGCELPAKNGARAASRHVLLHWNEWSTIGRVSTYVSGIIRKRALRQRVLTHYRVFLFIWRASFIRLLPTHVLLIENMPFGSKTRALWR